MSDITWNFDDASIYDGFSTESGYSLNEDCDLEHDQWLQNYLTTIDKVVFLGKSPPKNLPNHIIKECLRWRRQFNSKFSESERGAIFLKYSNQTESNWNAIESRSAARTNSLDHQRTDTYRFSSRLSKTRQGHRNSSTSKSSSGTEASLITLSSRDSFGEENNNLTRTSRSSIALQPLQISAKVDPSTSRKIIRSETASRRPVHLPPIDKNQGKPKSVPKVLDKQCKESRYNKKCFPSPPVFFSINDIFSDKKVEKDVDRRTIASTQSIFSRQVSYLEQSKSTGHLGTSNILKSEKYRPNDSSS